MSIAPTAPEAELSLPEGRFERARGLVPELGVRSAGGRKRRVLHGKMVPFDEWVEIDSAIEGHFMECFAPGSLDKTFAEGLGRIRCIFHHGKDRLGKLVIGKVIDLHADGQAAYYEVELFDSVEKESPLLVEGIEAGEYGTSMFFELVNGPPKYRPERSAYNPKGIAERRVLEAKVIEFGPTPFAIYKEATAGLRSLTDEMMVDRLAAEPERLRALMERSGVAVPVVETIKLAEPLSVTSPTLPTGDMSSTLWVNSGSARGTTEDPKTARRYERAAEFVGTTLWAMHPGVLATVLQIIGERVQGYRPTAEEIDERLGSRRARSEDSAPADSPVRVIDIMGPIVPHAGMINNASSEMRSVEAIQAELRDAVASADVKSILLNIDSPGGSVDLIPELAAEIRDARKVKPIIAVANTMAASGAYYLAAQASEIVVSPSSEVGSIGVYGAHQDISELQSMEGVKTTLISAGKYKVEGNPFEPLTDTAREEMQRRIDATYQMFLKDVAAGRTVGGRRVSVRTVEEDFGQGRMVMAENAVERGMADRVATFSQTLAQLEEAATSTSSTRAAALPADEPADEATRDGSDATSAPREPQHSESTDHLYGEKERPSWQL